jgi:hypothetical protein
MRNRFVALAGFSLLFAACASENANTDADQDGSRLGNDSGIELGHPHPGVDAGSPEPALDGGATPDGVCVQTELCVVGDHFDRTLCKCVPNTDGAVDAACVQTQLCIRGDHFDRTLCKCVPDVSDGGDGCATAADCQGVLPALCQLCSDGSAGCAHFTCVGGQCTIAYCL